MQNHNTMRRLTLLLAAWAFFLPSLGQGASAQEQRAAAWSQQTIDLMATLPVQHGGRVKPMETLAGLNLLMVNGKRKLKLEDETLQPTAWLLDCFFFPEQAKGYKCFRIQNDEVLTALGLDSRKKRDWYSFNELEPAKSKLATAAMQASQVEASDRDVVQRQLLKLHQDMRSFESLVGFLDPLRARYSTAGSESLRAIFGDGPDSSLSELLAGMGQLRELSARVGEERGDDYEAVETLLRELDSMLGQAGSGPAVFPPQEEVANDVHEWWNIADLMMASFQTGADLSFQLELLRDWEQMEAAKTDPQAFEARLGDLHGLMVGKADLRGEYEHIPLEVKMQRADLFTNSLVLYLLAFLMMALSWLLPRSKALRYGIWASMSLSTVLLVTGIVLRCIIRHRPPVVTLYDTILFVTAAVVIVSMIIEYLTRERIGLGVATVLGVIGMFLAGRYELKEIASAGDTMASVVAVLDTNYYLAIHVTTITLGYAGGLLAAGIAHIWILGQLFGYRRGDKAFYKMITRMIYGVICFSLLFAIFGTIMGGVWANDSWGRFWGWDPKENGALLICIWQLLTLHARLGGYIKDRGLAVMAILGGVVVSVSWWGVNLLNVGLHSYGFTSGVALLLLSMWAVEGLVILLAGLDKLRAKPA